MLSLRAKSSGAFGLGALHKRVDEFSGKEVIMLKTYQKTTARWYVFGCLRSQESVSLVVRSLGPCCLLRSSVRKARVKVKNCSGLCWLGWLGLGGRLRASLGHEARGAYRHIPVIVTSRTRPRCVCLPPASLPLLRASH